ncbi:MAG: hypothetical protein HQK93_01000 [Nitrospirae bacterium]|nr:hypothetical protein [Nitrospirota bacterium]
MFYRASGNKNGSNLLETKLVVNDLDDAPYALYKFGIFTNKILKNVTNRQKFVLYKGQCRLEVINEVNKILQDIVTYICNPPSFNKIEHWEILGITITIEETQYRSKSEGFEFTLRIRPQDIEPQDK